MDRTNSKKDSNWVKWAVIGILGALFIIFVLPFLVMMVFAGGFFSLFESAIESSMAPELIELGTPILIAVT